MPEASQVTILLQRLSGGDQSAEQELFALIYPDLRRLARSFMRRERAGHTLGATALVHEAYIRLAAGAGDWKNRVHFFAVASSVMRKILVDYARKHKSLRRGSGITILPVHEEAVASEEDLDDVLAVDEALTRLAKVNPRIASVAEMRQFGGLTEEEIGLLLDVSSRTVTRDWAEAKKWLLKELGDRERGVGAAG